MKKKHFLFFAVGIMMCCGSLAMAQVRDSARVYDVVTDADTFYLFPSFKPCFTPGRYDWAPLQVFVQEYVATDTLPVYGVAITVENYLGFFDNNDSNYNTKYRALLMNRLGPSPVNHYDASMELVDSVSLGRAHPRFCWFRYEDECDEKKVMNAPCYEFYFDTPQKINRVMDTFYVGRYNEISMVPTFGPIEYGGEYSSSYPSTIYHSVDYTEDYLDLFLHCRGYQDRKWGVAFPIIGFRCGPISQYWIDTCTAAGAVVRWRNVEEGTLFNVRLVGDDGSDTTYTTADTSISLTGLDESVRYNVMLRKQCHYATSNYDTTVHGEWLSYLSFQNGVVVHETDTTSIGGGGNDSIGGGTGILQSWVDTFTLTPNPSCKTVHVVLPAETMGGQLSICDMAGRCLTEFEIREQKMEMDVSMFPMGVYLVKIATPLGTVTKKLLVQ